jgi:Zn-dependent protease with chaperone function
MAGAKFGNRKHIVLFPALAFARLRGDAEALDAVLAHEVAHVLHRDLRMLAELEAFLRTILWLVPVAVLIAIVDSTTADIAAGEKAVSAFLASILAKSSIVILPLLIVISLPMLRFAEVYREALADAFAAQLVGPAALARAERALARDDHGTRAWKALDSKEVLYGWRLVAMFGFAIGAV